MSLNIASTILSGYNAGNAEHFKIKYSTTDILKVDTVGRTLTTNMVGFMAGNATAAYASPPLVSSWSNFINTWTGTLFNYGNGFNTSTGRFTAPVDGNYIFSTGFYLYNASANGGMYPCFAVNGSYIGRQSSLVNLRLRNHLNYYDNGQISDVLKLTAGDYVQVVMYCTTSTDQYYGPYSSFSGWLLG